MNCLLKAGMFNCYFNNFKQNPMCAAATPQIKGMSPLLIVSDLECAVAYYQQNLGFNLDFRYADFYAGINRDGYSIHLKQGEPSSGERKNKADNRDPEIIFSVDCIGELYEEFLGRSAGIVQSLRDMPYGKEFYAADPDGNVVAFVES
ncbi:MAG TPA: VOC family protein [Mucilaginibacter sp.]|nr:VOC family protein [Mucilaginibacter sp.]